MPPKAAAAAAAPKADEQVLPLKDQTLFKQVLRFYETKQYKKAMKSADAILKKHPNHGETLAMKGLTYNALNKKEEAHALVKRGLAMNIKSHVCWHVYGLLYRSETKYEDAIKCYQNAIKRDVNNLQIMKDLSNLQIQRRMLDGFTETRRKILQLKPANKHNWLAFAIGNHLTGNHEKALSILQTLQTTEGMGERAPNDKRPPSTEESELHMYRAMILEEAGKHAECIAYLEENKHEIIDKLALLEKRAQLRLKAGTAEDRAAAEADYRTLLNMNPENYAYHLGLHKALGFVDALHPNLTSFLGIRYAEADAQKLLQLYASDPLFQPTDKSIPPIAAVKRLPLHFTSGAAFQPLLVSYVRDKIRRGIPSLFSDLEPLYDEPAKAAFIQSTIEDLLTNLREGNRFAKDEPKDAESPSALMYMLIFAAQHYDHIGKYTDALKLVDDALAHTPTAPDIYMLKARIFKHAGDPITAYGFMDIARRLDTQDRYLNTKCVRYALRADELRKAEDTVSLFLRDGDGLKALSDLQVAWYENACAELHMRSKQYGRALKQLMSMDKHCVDMLEDQFDFHQYVLRKTTLRAYVDAIRWGNTLRGHRYHVRAALNTVRVYLRLHDAPLEDASHFEAVAAAANMNEEQRKEEQKRIKIEKTKQRKAEEKAAAAEAAAKAAQQPKPKQGQSKQAEDPDPEGAQLLATAQANPLQEATRFMQYLSAQHSNALETHTLGVALYVRKQRFLLALRHLSKALALNAQHPDTHVALASFLHAIRTPAVADALHPAVAAAINSTISAGEQYGKGASVEQLNDAFLKANPTSLAARVAAARVLLILDPVANIGKATTLASQFGAADSATRGEATAALTFLTDSLRAPAATVDAFKKAALARFPLAVAFGAVPKPPQPIDAPAAQ